MSLAALWFFVIGAFWSTYLVLEGFDFGVGMMLPVDGRDEDERGELLETIGPVWDANEVWLLVAGGLTFAAFPVWYGTWLEGAYLALVVLIVVLLLRILSFEWRGRVSPRWRGFWTKVNTTASVLAPLIWGIALTALLAGLPVEGGAKIGENRYLGTVLDFFSPYTVLGGLSLVALFLFHGAVFLGIRAPESLRARASARARQVAVPAALIVIAWFVATVVVASGTADRPAWVVAIPAAIGSLAIIAAAGFALRGRDGSAFAATAITVVSWVAALFIALFPRIMVSSLGLERSISIEQAGSSQYTLTVMTIAAVVLVPVIILYQWWGFRTLMARLGRGEPPLSSGQAGLVSGRGDQ